MISQTLENIEPLQLQDASIVLYGKVFTGEVHDRLFALLLDQVPWEQHVIRVYGRTLGAPRLSAWYGDPGAAYSYSGIHLDPLPWTEVLLEIKTVVDKLAATRFNSALLNLYRDGRDSVGWHSDAEAELGRNPVIASVSLGATRRFVFQHKKVGERRSLELAPGSVLLMGGRTQHCWRHQLPKTSRPVGPRINLSFRVIRRHQMGSQLEN